MDFRLANEQFLNYETSFLQLIKEKEYQRNDWITKG